MAIEQWPTDVIRSFVREKEPSLETLHFLYKYSGSTPKFLRLEQK